MTPRWSLYILILVDMKNELYEIIEKPHNGENKFWIKDEMCVLNGPYDTIEEAEADPPRETYSIRLWWLLSVKWETTRNNYDQ